MAGSVNRYDNSVTYPGQSCQVLPVRWVFPNQSTGSRFDQRWLLYPGFRGIVSETTELPVTMAD